MSSHLFATPGNELVTLPLRESICKIDISGYSLDNFRNFNPEGFTMLCHLGEASDGLRYFPKSSQIVLNTSQHSTLIKNFQRFIPNIAEDFEISQEAALQKSIDFFRINKLLLNP